MSSPTTEGFKKKKEEKKCFPVSLLLLFGLQGKLGIRLTLTRSLTQLL